jgi:hypothetical protein
MPYVIRDTEGGIVGLSEQEREDANEQLPLSHPEVQAFLDNARERLSSSDAETIRVIEDLVDVLIQKKLIMLTDLPPAAQQKLSERQNMRSDLHVLGDLMVDEDDIL